MKIGIICAGDREAEPFIPMIERGKTSQKAMLTFYEGRVEGVPVVVLYSGVCKVNAAIATQILIDTYECNAILNAGTAGGLHPQIRLLDTVVSVETAYHDVDKGILTEFHPWMETIYFKADQHLLEIAEMAADNYTDRRVWFGRMMTGEAFITDEQKNKIVRIYQALSVDMETAAVAHVCYVNKTPFIAVRTITDAADHQGSAMFEENCVRAAALSAEFVRKMLLESGWGEKDEV